MRNEALFPRELWVLGPLHLTDTLLVSVVLSLSLALAAGLLARSTRARSSLIVVYEALERSISGMVQLDARPLMPLVLTQWLFIGSANLLGVVPAVGSPTRDLSITSALALVAFFWGHYYALRVRGIGYLKSYAQPNLLLLPFNIVGELSRTVALSLRLFGNMLSGQLIGAILVYLAGLLIPLPLLLLSVLTSVVQSYIFGVLTLVFAASSLQVQTKAPKTATPAPTPTKEPTS